MNMFCLKNVRQNVNLFICWRLNCISSLFTIVCLKKVNASGGTFEFRDNCASFMIAT